ncbi:MAG: flagellar hook-basal body complex protein [bacterium]
MNASLYTGVLGLQNHQIRMDVIGNNIANINTYGFKRGRATFADLINRTYHGAAAPRNGRGGINPLQVGMGMTTVAVTNIMTQGQIEMSGRLTDVAIDGNGWFVLEDDSGETVYTRDGAFGLDREGNLVNANGWKVQGWSRVTVGDDNDFTVDTTRPVDDIKFIYGQKMEAQATTEVGLRCNLDLETRSLIADGIDPKEGFAKRSDLLVDLYDAVSSTARQYTPVHLGIREGDWVEVKASVTEIAASDDYLMPIETEKYLYFQVTNDTDIGDLENAIANALEALDTERGTINAQVVYNEDEGRFEIYNHSLTGQNDFNTINVEVRAVSGSAIRQGYLLRESTYPTLTGTRLGINSAGLGGEMTDEIVGWADYQINQFDLNYGNINGSAQIFAEVIQARVEMSAGVYNGADGTITLDEWTRGYTNFNAINFVRGTEVLTVNGTIWTSVTAFTGAANEYRIVSGAGGSASIVFNTAAALQPASGSSMILQFRPPRGVEYRMVSGAGYTLDSATGRLSLVWNNSTASAELLPSAGFGDPLSGTIRIRAEYTTEDRKLEPPTGIMNNRWADFAQEIASKTVGGSGKGRTDFNNSFTSMAGAVADESQSTQPTYLVSTRQNSAYTYRTSVDVFDSLGDDHTLQLIFTHVGSNYDLNLSKRFQNRWYWRSELPYTDVYAFDSMDNIDQTNTTTRLSGQLEFDENGLIQVDMLSGNNGPIRFDASPVGYNGVSTRSVDTTSIQIDFDGDDVDKENGILREGVTQMASPSTTHVFEQNGWTMGILETFSVDASAVIEGRYSNNVVKPIAQLGLAMFPNQEGLHKEGDNVFSLSANSGLATIQPAFTGGRGSVVGAALEQSNVDIVQEFTNMIITERGFQANSRIITTSDEMLTEVLNLKR